MQPFALYTIYTYTTAELVLYESLCYTKLIFWLVTRMCDHLSLLIPVGTVMEACRVYMNSAGGWAWECVCVCVCVCVNLYGYM